MNEVEDESENNENDCYPLGPSCELSVEGLALSLEGVGIRTAADSAGKAIILAALKKNDNYKEKSAKELDDCNCKFHRKFYPFKQQQKN